MSNQIEQIRARIEAKKSNTNAAGDYDEYADGIGVGLASALRIIDEVEKEHPTPAEDTIKGWVARDGHGALVFSNEKPSRLEWCGWKLWKISRGTPAVVLPNTFLPSLRWEDEPIEVEIIIKTK